MVQSRQGVERGAVVGSIHGWGRWGEGVGIGGLCVKCHSHCCCQIKIFGGYLLLPCACAFTLTIHL